MKVVVLCGGRGARLREEADYRPKPMIPIGNRPILWHIMKIYAQYGHRDFILCLGYKGEMIRKYFQNYLWNTCDVTLHLGLKPSVHFHSQPEESDWNVTLADTGEDSMTAYRIRQIEEYIGNDDTFLFTYGDCIGNIDIPASIQFHEKSGQVCTATAVHPPGRFGELGFDEAEGIVGFNQKVQTEEGYIYGGYMVCNRRIFGYLPDDPGASFEQTTIRRLAAEGQIAGFRHEGFWHPADTPQEISLLNDLWEKGNAPWKVW